MPHLRHMKYFIHIWCILLSLKLYKYATWNAKENGKSFPKDKLVDHFETIFQSFDKINFYKWISIKIIVLYSYNKCYSGLKDVFS